MFKTRLLSGIILVALAALLIGFGKEILLFSILAVSLIGMFELYRVFKFEKTLLAGVGYLVTVLHFLNIKFQYIPDMTMLVMDFLMVLLFVYVFTYPKYNANQIFACFFGFFYVGMMLSYLPLIRNLQYGIYYIGLIVICSWGCDTCAYCVGKLIGKHKMSPVLSPKKSIEGAVGGVLGTGLLSFGYLQLFSQKIHFELQTILIICLVCMATSLVSMVGDLAASAIKRNFDIKDYGTLIPGHGGILDRFDSVIITAPIIYYFVLYIGG